MQLVVARLNKATRKWIDLFINLFTTGTKLGSTGIGRGIKELQN